MDEACELAVMEGEMFKKNGLYHYSINKEDTFLPDFPKEYDTLVIEYILAIEVNVYYNST